MRDMWYTGIHINHYVRIMESDKKWFLAIILLVVGLIAGAVAGFYSGAVTGQRSDRVQGYEEGRMAGIQEAAMLAQQKAAEKNAAASVNPFATSTNAFPTTANPYEGVTINPFAK